MSSGSSYVPEFGRQLVFRKQIH